DIWIVCPNGENQQQITNDSFPDWNPHWGRDGRIYFHRNIKGRKNIWSVRPRVLNLSEQPESQSPNREESPDKNKADDEYYVYTGTTNQIIMNSTPPGMDR
ncbi:TolB family protein, partial [Planctomycetota bacterium]